MQTSLSNITGQSCEGYLSGKITDRARIFI
jgi:hypothetical protein